MERSVPPLLQQLELVRNQARCNLALSHKPVPQGHIIRHQKSIHFTERGLLDGLLCLPGLRVQLLDSVQQMLSAVDIGSQKAVDVSPGLQDVLPLRKMEAKM